LEERSGTSDAAIHGSRPDGYVGEPALIAAECPASGTHQDGLRDWVAHPSSANDAELEAVVSVLIGRSSPLKSDEASYKEAIQYAAQNLRLMGS
jgi:hypothetical protein